MLKADNPKTKVMQVIHAVSYICLRLCHCQRADVLGSGPMLKCQSDYCITEHK